MGFASRPDANVSAAEQVAEFVLNGRLRDSKHGQKQRARNERNQPGEHESRAK